jgi:hypothetical protein
VSTSKCVLAVTLCAAALCASCDSPTPAQPNEPLLGLAQASATDSAGRPVPPGGTTAPTPGHVRGVVRTSELTRPGTDTLVNSVRLGGVRVTALPVTDLSASPPKTAAAAADVITNANGEFTLPELPGGPYVVTFTPPTSSPYQGAWVMATISSSSADYPWWVTLFKK